MPNHVHLILAPSDEDGLRRALGEAHRRHTLPELLSPELKPRRLPTL
jgi:hypothetical protein